MVDEICLSEALLEGTKEIFETMIFMDVEKVVDEHTDSGGDSLLGAITYTGDIEGYVAFNCTMPCAKVITANMLGMEPSADISKADISDAIGEVVNMIMGSVKTRLRETVGNLEVSIPTVVSGHELENSLGEGVNKASLQINIHDEFTAGLSLTYKETQGS